MVPGEIEMKKLLPVIIKNKVNKKEELLQCLVDEEKRFEGFAKVKNTRNTIYWHKRNRHKTLKVLMRKQDV